MDDPAEWCDYLVAIAGLVITAGLSRLNTISNALSRATLERLAETGLLKARLYLWFYRSRDFMGQMVFLALIAVITVGSLAFLSLFKQSFAELSGIWHVIAQWIALCIYVFFALLIRNTLPAYRREENSDRPLPKLPVVFLPLHLIFYLPTLVLQHAQNIFVSENDTKARKEEELRSFVESETEEGTIEAEEREMIEGIFEFGDTTVKEVMVPRIDMVCAEIDTPQQELLEVIKESRHSRIPIYKERIDNIKGVLYVKDLLFYLGTEKPWALSDIMRTPYFVPETKTLDTLLAEFKREKVHMAIVVGEYGGTSGLVTMEDIIEEIVGDIQDEYDEEEPLFQWQEEDRLLVVDARIDIEDLNFVLNVEFPQNGYETLGGFIYNQLGHVPNPGEILSFENLVIAVQEVDGQRITRVTIEKRESDAQPNSENAEIA